MRGRIRKAVAATKLRVWAATKGRRLVRSAGAGDIYEFYKRPDYLSYLTRKQKKQSLVHFTNHLREAKGLIDSSPNAEQQWARFKDFVQSVKKAKSKTALSRIAKRIWKAGFHETVVKFLFQYADLHEKLRLKKEA